MPHCAFLTMQPTPQGTDDERVRAPLAALGWDLSLVPWNSPAEPWERFDAVVIRSTWDYHRSPLEFIAALERIVASGAQLQNSLDLVRWNLEKTYLRDLQVSGAPVVPSLFGQSLRADELEGLFAALGCEELVIKPTISASADDTHRLERRQLERGAPDWLEAIGHRAYLAQPFQAGIVEEGEYSVVFLGGEFSHSTLKAPRAGDFRVQSEHGGSTRAVQAPPALVRAARVALDVAARFGPTPLYARADLVRDGSGGFLVMELELIEPGLFLDFDPSAASRLARAVSDLGALPH